jgi:hypothetical protein
MKGGDLSPAQKSGIAAFTTAALIATAVAHQYGLDAAVGSFAVSGGVVTALSSLADGKTKEAATAVADYLKARGAYKIAESAGTLGKASLSLADNGLSLVFAAIRFPVSLATATVGIAGKLVGRTAAAVQTFSDKLESPEEQNKQADLIIKNGTLAFTAALAALTLSGALPIMTIFSFMLWTGKLYASPLGRAVGIIELYMWWINQTDADQKAIAAQTKALVSDVSKGTKVTLDKVGPKVAEAIALVGGKIKEKSAEAGANFEAGFAEGIQDAEHPLMTALSLGFCRAAGLYLDTKAPEPAAGEVPDDLKNLADTLLAGAFKRDASGKIVGVNADELKAAIDNLKRIRETSKSVEDARAALAPAKQALVAALQNAGIGPGAAPGAAAAAPGAAAAAPVAAPVGGPGSEPSAAPSRRRGVAAAAGEAATGEAAPPSRAKKARSAAAPVGEGGRRRKTRRKRMVRRVTKKVKDFYY